MTETLPPLFEGAPRCKFYDGCDSYRTHVDAETLRNSARRHFGEVKKAIDMEDYVQANEFRRLGNSDSVAFMAVRGEIERLRRNQRLCIDCPYN